MKKLVILVLFFSTITFAQNVYTVEKSQSKYTVQIFGGLGFQTAPKDFNDYWRIGIIGGGAITMKASEIWRFRGRIDYGYHSLNSDKFIDYIKSDLGKNINSDVTAEGGSIQYFNFNVDLIFYIIPQLYIVGGGGGSLISKEVLTVKINNVGLDLNEDDSEFGGNISFGLGYIIPLNEKANIFFEAKFNRQFFGDFGDISTFPILVGFSTQL